MPIGSNDGVDFFCRADYNKGERATGDGSPQRTRSLVTACFVRAGRLLLLHNGYNECNDTDNHTGVSKKLIPCNHGHHPLSFGAGGTFM